MATTTPHGRTLTPAIEGLYGFHDHVSGLWLRFLRPFQAPGLWAAYVEGARRSYRKYQVERALTLPEPGRGGGPVFCVATDQHGTVRSGWYVNGPLHAVSEAYAPAEFAAEPGSATTIAQWISELIPDGIVELKGAWVDPEGDNKATIADLAGRAILHALRLLDVRYAFCTAADHAVPRWKTAGGRQLGGIASAPYPDDRYRTTLLWWDARKSVEWASEEQRKLFLAESLRAVGRRRDGSAGGER